MVLKDDLFTIKSTNVSDKGTSYLLDLNPEHFIYQAHFPGMPITPGVCIVQMVKEVLEVELGQTLEIAKVKNVKFLSVISPKEHLQVACDLTKIQMETTNRLVKAQAVISSGSEALAKVSIICGIL